MIGKITRQELHPKLLNEIDHIKDNAIMPPVTVSTEEPELSDGHLWYDLNEMKLLLRYDEEWIEICKGGSSQVEDNKIEYNIKQEVVEITDKVKYVDIPSGINHKEGIFKVFANGLLLKEGLDFEIDNNKIYRKDMKDWNSESKKTIFLFTSIVDKEKEGYIKFNHEFIKVSKNVSSIEISPSIKNIMNSSNSIMFVNKIKEDENNFYIEDNKIIKKDGEWKASPDTHFEFTSFKVDEELTSGQGSKLEKEVNITTTKDSPDTLNYEDEEGYKGLVNKVTEKEEIVKKESKEVVAQESDKYEDDEGFKGVLEKYLYQKGETIIKEQTLVLSAKEDDPDTMEYDKDGYKGVLKKNKSEDNKPIEKDIELDATKDDPDTKEYDKDGFKGTLKKELISGKLTKEEKKTVTAQDSANYDKDGFKGTLEKYVHSGEYIPEEKKNVTGQDSAHYDKDGFKGELERYLYSGSYTPSDTKYVTGQTSANYNSGGYTGTLERYVYSGSYTPSDTKYVTGQSSANYNSGGYTGTLTRYQAGTKTETSRRNILETRGSHSVVQIGSHDDDISYVHFRVSRYEPSNKLYLLIQAGGTLPYINDAGGQFKDLATTSELTNEERLGSFELEYKYWVYPDGTSFPETISGTIKDDFSNLPSSGKSERYIRDVSPPITMRNEYNSRYESLVKVYMISEKEVPVYKYQGNVTKPASDTRVYRYRGDVTKPASDTRVYKYKGEVIKPESDTRVYKYKGEVIKPESDTRVFKYKGKITKIPEKNTISKKIELEANKDDPETMEYDKDGFKGTLKKTLISGELIPGDSKEVNNETSSNYNKDGYKGTLEKYLYSGSYTPSDTKNVTNQASANYDKDGYKGTLEKYLYSGSYTPSDSKTAEKKVYKPVGTEGVIDTSDVYNYNSGGYKGTLTYNKSKTEESIMEALLEEKDGFYMYYTGTVTRPASDTRVYRYKGEVTRPESDTRVYRYKGTVTKDPIDTRVFKYIGIVTKESSSPIYYYEGKVTKTIKTEDIFKYKGTVYKETIIEGIYKYKGKVYKIIPGGEQKDNPLIRKYISRMNNSGPEIEINNLRYSSKNYYEVIANGIFLYPEDYNISNNKIFKKNNQNWNKDTHIIIIEISGIKIQYL